VINRVALIRAAYRRARTRCQRAAGAGDKRLSEASACQDMSGATDMQSYSVRLTPFDLVRCTPA
jgi:hypothetical protein